MDKMTALQKLQSANRYKIHEEPIDIPLDDNEVIKAKLISPDLFKMHEEMEALKRDAMAELRLRGDDKKPLDENVWNEEIEGYKNSKEFKELLKSEREKKLKELGDKKPKNLAEQQAPYIARLRIVKTIIPQLLRDRETNEILFPTQAELNAVSQIIGSNADLMGLLSKAFAKLNEQSEIEQIEVEDLKN